MQDSNGWSMRQHGLDTHYQGGFCDLNFSFYLLWFVTNRYVALLLVQFWVEMFHGELLGLRISVPSNSLCVVILRFTEITWEWLLFLCFSEFKTSKVCVLVSVLFSYNNTLCKSLGWSKSNRVNEWVTKWDKICVNFWWVFSCLALASFDFSWLCRSWLSCYLSRLFQSYLYSAFLSSTISHSHKVQSVFNSCGS